MDPNTINLMTAIFTGLAVIVAIAIPFYQSWETKKLAKTEKLALYLSYFDRQVFKGSEESEDPVEMYLAIRETRISLQKEGAQQIPDKLSKKAFNRIIKILLKTEDRVKSKFPVVEILSRELKIPTDRNLVKTRMGWEQYTAAVKEMTSIRKKVWRAVGKIEEWKASHYN